MLSNLLKTYRLWATRPVRARAELALRLRVLFGQPAPFVLGGVHDWQIEGYAQPRMPAIDVFWGGLTFSFLPEVPSALRLKLFGAELLSPRTILKETFRRRLLTGEDVIPQICIFLDPRFVLRLKDPGLFSSYLDTQWHLAIQAALRQMPALPFHNEEFPLIPGSWASRRAYLEEASTVSFFSGQSPE